MLKVKRANYCCFDPEMLHFLCRSAASCFQSPELLIPLIQSERAQCVQCSAAAHETHVVLFPRVVLHFLSWRLVLDEQEKM